MSNVIRDEKKIHCTTVPDERYEERTTNTNDDINKGKSKLSAVAADRAHANWLA